QWLAPPQILANAGRQFSVPLKTGGACVLPGARCGNARMHQRLKHGAVAMLILAIPTALPFTRVTLTGLTLMLGRMFMMRTLALRRSGLRGDGEHAASDQQSHHAFTSLHIPLLIWVNFHPRW